MNAKLDNANPPAPHADLPLPKRALPVPPGWKPTPDRTMRDTARALALACLILAPINALGGYMILSEQAERKAAAVSLAEQKGALDRLLALPPGPALDAAAASHGRDLFARTCAACHGQDAKGVEGLGKDLTRSWFVAAQNDADLHTFVVQGRPGAVPMPMPPKGGNPGLSDKDVSDLVVYMRGLQDARRMPALAEPVVETVAAASAAEVESALAAAGGDAELAEYIAHGSKVYASSCSACHGKDARGLKGNGKDLVNSEFCKTTGDDDLLAFIKKGRDPSDPANTTGVGMPAKGGNPALSDDDILDVIEYIRSLRTTASAR